MRLRAFYDSGKHKWAAAITEEFLTSFDRRQNFDHSWQPLRTAQWGPFLLLSLRPSSEGLAGRPRGEGDVAAGVGEEWLGSAAPVLENAGVCSTDLRHVARREYTINCNWKVYCDNYLDGGYHVAQAHPRLAAGLDLKSYATHIHGRCSVQTCCSAGSDVRLGKEATYCFVYPNLMINRYGPWMDTNLVLPLSPSRCRVVFDYFLPSAIAANKEFVEESLASSHLVQEEDVELCERVQEGLQSPAYDVGRYAPKVEHPMHHFHCAVYRDLTELAQTSKPS